MTEVMTQDDTEPRLIFSFYLCLRLTSPNYAFMRRRLYSKRKVKEYKYKDNTRCGAQTTVDTQTGLYLCIQKVNHIRH